MPEPSCPVCGSPRAAPYATPFVDPLLRCLECGTRYVFPVPAAADLRARYEAEHRTGKWASLFAAGDPVDPPRRAGLLTGLSAGGTARLLDVGCGDGRFLDAASTAGWSTVGLELSLEAARNVADRHPVLVGALEALDEAAFDAITFWDVLEHLPRPAEAIRGAARLVAPGGVVAVSLPNAAGTEALIQRSRWRFHDVAAYGHLVHVGPDQLARLFRDAGLEPIHRETRGSVDLRDLLGRRPPRGARRALALILDRASGLLARVAQPALRGNTLLMVARRARPVR